MKDKEINSYYEPSIKTSRHDDIDDLKYTLHQEQKVNYSLIENIKRLHQENKQLKDNWNYIKKMLKEARQEEFNINGYCGTCTDGDIDFLLNKMQEIEKRK